MPEASLIYRDMVSLTVPPMTAWILTVLMLMGIVSVVHTVLDWRDQLRQQIAALWRQRTRASE